VLFATNWKPLKSTFASSALDTDPADEFSTEEDKLLGRKPADLTSVGRLAKHALDLAELDPVYLADAEDLRFKMAGQTAKALIAELDEHCKQNPEHPPTKSLEAQNEEPSIEPDVPAKLSELQRSTANNP
jgi:hypothetical protein